MNKEEVSTVLERKTGYHVLTDRSLKLQTKDRLVWLVRILEHNWANAELSLSQQAENVKDWEPVKHGHWVNTGWRNSAYRADCSECGQPAYHYEYKGVQRYYSVCPHCGTKMDEEVSI